MDRFWAKVEKTATCWLWKGWTTPTGYGLAYFSEGGKRKNRVAHRVAYELMVGPIPEGRQLDHLCRVRNCVNPDHLEAVTQTENVRRGISPTAINRRKKACKHGHPFTPENTDLRSDGTRRCIQCQRELNQRVVQRRSAARRQGRQLRATATGKNYARGERAPGSRLTATSVVQIRLTYEEGGISLSELARRYGVNVMTISNVVKRVNWTHV